MKPYTFYLHDFRREPPSFRFVHCADDDEARHRAEDLLVAEPRLAEIEVFDGGRRFRVARGEGPSPTLM